MPKRVKAAVIGLYTQVGIVSTNLYDDVQELKQIAAKFDQEYTPKDPFRGAPGHK